VQYLPVEKKVKMEITIMTIKVDNAIPEQVKISGKDKRYAEVQADASIKADKSVKIKRRRNGQYTGSLLG
jgi:hypothetical protein